MSKSKVVLLTSSAFCIVLGFCFAGLLVRQALFHDHFSHVLRRILLLGDSAIYRPLPDSWHQVSVKRTEQKLRYDMRSNVLVWEHNGIDEIIEIPDAITIQGVSVDDKFEVGYILAAVNSVDQGITGWALYQIKFNCGFELSYSLQSVLTNSTFRNDMGSNASIRLLEGGTMQNGLLVFSVYVDGLTKLMIFDPETQNTALLSDYIGGIGGNPGGSRVRVPGRSQR